MGKTLELKNLEIGECCTLEVKTEKLVFYKGNKKIPGFTGLYFRNDDHFFAIYPTKNGPIAFFEGKEFPITKELHISLQKDGKSRKFIIEDYNIEINYTESPYIGFDCWSDEIDVDLFYGITKSYQDDTFYKKYTWGQWETHPENLNMGNRSVYVENNPYYKEWKSKFKGNLKE
jgi:hypothetical protein